MLIWAASRWFSRSPAVMQTRLGKLLPSGFSIVDVYAAMFSRWRGSIGKEWLAEGHIPKLDNLALAVSRRPAIAPVWKRHFGDRT